MEASVAIQVLPQYVASTEETVRIVDEAIAYIKETFPDAYVGPFETTIEGDYDTCLRVLAGVGRICAKAGAPEVATYAKIFFAPETGVLTTEEKIGKYHGGVAGAAAGADAADATAVVDAAAAVDTDVR